MKLLYNFASRSRPKKLLNCLRNIKSMARHNDYEIILKLDLNDAAVNNSDFQIQFDDFLLQGDCWVKIAWGHSRNKIHAINRDIPTTLWDIIISTSDDIEFTQPGFDLDIIKDMHECFPDTDGVLHYPDGFEHGPILTLPIIGREYYRRDRFVYNNVYHSLFCDEEALAIAGIRGCLYSGTRQFYKHLHPAWVGGEIDSQLKHTQSFYQMDGITFKKRKAVNFGL